MSVDPKRIDVWYALSDLYLDQELTESDFVSIASRLNQSGFSVLEIEKILFTEVHPALQFNLKQVAGQWGYFDKEFVVETITKIIDKPLPNSFFAKLLVKYHEYQFNKMRSLIDPDWNKVKAMLQSNN